MQIDTAKLDIEAFDAPLVQRYLMRTLKDLLSKGKLPLVQGETCTGKSGLAFALFGLYVSVRNIGQYRNIMWSLMLKENAGIVFDDADFEEGKGTTAAPNVKGCKLLFKAVLPGDSPNHPGIQMLNGACSN